MLQKFAPIAAAAVLALVAAQPAFAVVTTYGVTLNGQSEVPPNNSPGVGLGLVTFNDANFTMTVNEVYFGLIGGAVTGSHIHCCTATPLSGTAPVVVDFMSSGFPTTLSGNFDFTFTLSQATFNTLAAGAAQGRAYLNIHNATFPGGEIRGFLIPTAVPEPSTYALLGLGLVGVVAATRRKVAARA